MGNTIAGVLVGNYGVVCVFDGLGSSCERVAKIPEKEYQAPRLSHPVLLQHCTPPCRWNYDAHLLTTLATMEFGLPIAIQVSSGGY